MSNAITVRAVMAFSLPRKVPFERPSGYHQFEAR
jgi:hypothetical protein